jgi:hypothetical protein
MWLRVLPSNSRMLVQSNCCNDIDYVNDVLVYFTDADHDDAFDDSHYPAPSAPAFVDKDIAFRVSRASNKQWTTRASVEEIHPRSATDLRPRCDTGES